MSSNALYGYARFGASGNGYVYRIGLAGGFTHLLDFDGTNASRPYSTPTLSGNTLFGISYSGGIYGGGNVFRIGTDGLSTIRIFTTSFPRQSGANTTGANPNDLAGLVLSGNVLYGTTSVSGTGGQGTVFQLNTDGSGFTVLHSFQYTDGAEPESLVLSGGTLYGMTSYGFQGISLGDGGVYALILQPTLKPYLVRQSIDSELERPVLLSLYRAKHYQCIHESNGSRQSVHNCRGRHAKILPASAELTAHCILSVQSWPQADSDAALIIWVPSLSFSGND